MRILIGLICTLILIFTLCECKSKELRGEVRKSDDNLTYLVIEEDCGADNTIYIDGKEWTYKIGEKGEISPGRHTLNCGGELSIVIENGTTFHFDYWGP